MIELARQNNLSALVLSDINTSMGIIDFVRLCKKENIKPIAGIEFRDGDRRLYTAIARNNEGLREINEKLSGHNLFKSSLEIENGEFSNAYVVHPFGSKLLKDLKDNEYIGIKPAEVRKLFSSEFKYDQSRLLISHSVSFENEAGYILHKNLRAIDHNILITKLTDQQYATPDEMMFSPGDLAGLYSEYPQIIKNTEKIISDCFIDFDFQSAKNKKTFTGNAYDDKILLEKLAIDGLEYRYGKSNREAKKRILKELEIIDRLGFSSYFLITWDIIRYSMSRGFYHVGRGSGANSIVAYCLKITDVDPIELDLYFERFINPKRTSPPDFDIDYSWKEREDVQDYIFKRYGRKHTALLGATSTFKGKSVYRELGKVHGLPKHEIDELVENPHKGSQRNNICRNIHSIAEMMFDFPNIRSVHAGGILVSEEPITYYTALDLPPKGFPTTQWDMYVAEDLGYEKLDILSQRGIGHIKECVDIVKQNKGRSVDFHQVELFKKDGKVRQQLKDGETIGCFYIESPAMRGLLKKLRCSDYLTLVAASSIIRPGVARSGMMREYIYRFHHPESFDYIHPVMEEQLKETYGVMVYQEDVLKICHHFAGLDLADADVLRRLMSGKKRNKSELDRIIKKFFQNCSDRGYPDDISKEVWRQIESFAGYSFSKAHSASYAVESFQSLYLKAHYPLEFMVAVINNFGGFYHTWVYFYEARREGANIELPCVNESDYNTSISGIDVYAGFIHISSLESRIAKEVPLERKRDGLYAGLENFIDRINVGLEQIILLIRIGAFRFTGKTKAQLLWEAHLYLRRNKANTSYKSLFHTPAKNFTLPRLEYSLIEDAYDEVELLGFPVSMTYFDMLKTDFRGEVFARDLINNNGKKVRMIGLLVAIKFVKTVKREIMHFAAFLDADGEFFDTVHFPDSLRRYPFKGRGVYLIYGEITQEFDFPNVTVEKMAKLSIQTDPRD
ncbi:MAG: DNA polymerase III subunit alpha [Bacteroidales bacterium]|nr:DNA polymerase III subunit alpha [Bacteroidales bacterium]